MPSVYLHRMYLLIVVYFYTRQISLHLLSSCRYLPLAQLIPPFKTLMNEHEKAWI